MGPQTLVIRNSDDRKSIHLSVGGRRGTFSTYRKVTQCLVSCQRPSECKRTNIVTSFKFKCDVADSGVCVPTRSKIDSSEVFDVFRVFNLAKSNPLLWILLNVSAVLWYVMTFPCLCNEIHSHVS